MKSKIIILLAVFNGGCATVMNSTTSDVEITSNPPNAKFFITDKHNREVAQGVTPKTIELDNGCGYFCKGTYTVKYEKEGYLPSFVVIDAKQSRWYLGNNLLFLLGVIGGLVIDPLTGAMYELPTSASGLLASEKDAPKKTLPDTSKYYTVIKNKFNISATQLDYEKTIAKCRYESTKVATSAAPQSYQEKAVLYSTSDDSFSSLANTLNQMSANEKNAKLAQEQKFQHQLDVTETYKLCLEADGFFSARINEKDVTEQIKQICPSIAIESEPCFIPGQ